MLYYSTNGQSPAVLLREAVIRGLAPDGGLYMPASLPEIDSSFFETIQGKSLKEISWFVAEAFMKDDIPSNVIHDIVDDALDFPIPLMEVERGIFSLELFHGPTMAFKDVGARFMSRVMSYFYRNESKALNVIVATSGDTGSAVASGFFEVEGINVFVLFPKGKVSPLQQKQITTWGGNIHAIEVAGSFDDCQNLAKLVLRDRELGASHTLTSANSINIARLIPQSFYYFSAFSQLEDTEKGVVFSVPCGNFGNLTGGLMANSAGLPVKKFIASTNVNNVFPKFLETGKFVPAPSRQTISNAMDVGDPSNFSRISELMGNSLVNFRRRIVSFPFSDKSTAGTIDEVFARTGYLMDPHGAVAYLGAMRYLDDDTEPVNVVFLETAHPAKFPETISRIIGHYDYLPPQLNDLVNRKEVFQSIPKDAGALKNIIFDVNS